MDQLQECIDHLVSSGIRSYIGLLCCGERVRSRRVLSDTMQISSIAAGGPSALVGVSAVAAEGTNREEGGRAAAGDEAISFVRCVAFFTLRSLLASLLVLRATAYWARVPALHELQQACARFNRCLEGPAGAVVAAPPDVAGPDGAVQAGRPNDGHRAQEAAVAPAGRHVPAERRHLPLVAKFEVLDRGDLVETPNGR